MDKLQIKVLNTNKGRIANRDRIPIRKTPYTSATKTAKGLVPIIVSFLNKNPIVTITLEGEDAQKVETISTP